ncbi:MAG: hypothetical protein J5I90_22710 [Caldilineales bacterium]|nr:hypothetical protein [Caldilineales bacterium]
MSRRTITALVALAIILLGAIGLLYNFGLLADYLDLAAYIAAGLLAATGLAFLVLLVFQQDRWLYAVPATSFLALGSIVYLATLENIEPAWLAALFLAGIAAGFLLLFISNRRERWWALLQAGTIGVIALVGLGIGVPAESEALIGAALFGGFAVSFLLVFLLAGDMRRFLWALIMAAALAIFAMTILMISLGEQNLVIRLWPILLILIGAYMIVRVITGRGRAQPGTPSLPAEDLEVVTPEPVANEPARIVRQDRPASPADEPRPAPAATPEPAADPLPPDLPALDPNDPAASLDALLEASRKAGGQ